MKFTQLVLLYTLVKTTKCSFISSTFYRMANIVVTQVYKPDYAMSMITCGVLCERESQCKTFNFRKVSGAVQGECQLSDVAMKDLHLHSHHSNTWTTFSKTDPSAWILMFQGVTDIGIDVYKAWINGIDITTNDTACMTYNVANCTKHFRNKLVESWDRLPIKEVKFAFVKDGVEVVYIVFDGIGADLISWFETSRVQNSSWSNINLYNLQTEKFSIEGDPPSRRFFIVDLYSGCENDRVLVLALTGSGHPCSYDYQPLYPRFLYSKLDTWSYFHTNPGDYALADLMTISVRVH